MIRTTSSLYRHFHCRASACVYPCCEGWGIRASEKDIAKFDALPEKDREKVLSHIDLAAGLYRMEDGRCPFFNRDGLCSLILDYGYAFIGEICDRFPRMDKKIGKQRDLSVETCCPYTALELLSGGPLSFEEETIETDDLAETGSPSACVHELLFRLRDFLFAVFTTVDGKLPGKLFILLSFTMRVRKLLETEALTPEAADALLAEYIADYGSLLEECGEKAADRRLSGACFIQFFRIYKEAYNPEKLKLFAQGFPEKHPAKSPVPQNPAHPADNFRTASAMQTEPPKALKPSPWSYPDELSALADRPEALSAALAEFSRFMRKAYPNAVNNCFLHALFKYWVHPGEKCFGDHLLGEIAVLILIRIMAFNDYLQRGALSPERYALLYSALDRDYAHNETVREAILSPVKESLERGDYSLFLFPFDSE